MFSNPTTFVFGFWFVTPIHLAFLKDRGGPEDVKEAKNRFLAHNIVTIMGYFPLLGIISGIFRNMAYKPEPIGENKFKNFIKVQRFRSRVEIAGFGSLFFPIDIIFTLGRKLQKISF